MKDDARFRFVPLPSGRELFLPLRPAAATAGGLALYAATSRKARIFHALLNAALRLHLAPLVLRERSLADSPATAHIRDHAVFDQLRARFSSSELCFAIYQGKQSIVRKPTILVMDRRGSPLAFAKVGWNDLTRKLIEQEHWASQFLHERNLRRGRPAPPLGFIEDAHNSIMLSAPQPVLNSASILELSPLCIEFLIEVGELQTTRMRLLDSTFWQRMMTRLEKLRPMMEPRQAEVLDRHLGVLARGLGETELPWMLRLGDFLPWNFGIDEATNQIVVIDLEFAEQESLVGWDVFHFLIGIRQRLAPLDVQELMSLESCRGYFEHFGIARDALPYLQLAYLLDLTLFYRDLWAGTTLTPLAVHNFEMRLHAAEEVACQLA